MSAYDFSRFDSIVDIGGGENIGFPCWSPDGRWIAAKEFGQRRTKLVVFPSSGGEIRTVASEFRQYFVHDLSPDSRRIVFAGLQNDVWNICWISFPDGKVTEVTHFTRSAFVRYPAWSPKGTRSCSNTTI